MKKEAMNSKENKGGYMGEFEGKNRRGGNNAIIITKIAKEIFKKITYWCNQTP